VKTVTDKVVTCKAFIGLTIRAKMIGGDFRFYLKFEIFGQTDRVAAKSPIFFIYFRP